MRIQPKSRPMMWRLEPLEIWDKTKPRGLELFFKGIRVAQVVPFRVGFTDFDGWYWLAEYAGSDGIKCVPRRDTIHTPVKDIKRARGDCEAYVRGCLGRPRHGCRRRLSWVKDTPDPNRAVVLSPPCGGKFLLNETVVVGEVKPFRVRFGEYKGWYWVAKLPPLEEFAHLTVVPQNTKDVPVDTLEIAKCACDGYLRNQLLISPLRKRVRPPRKRVLASKKSSG
jgi:hypothetical protein